MINICCIYMWLMPSTVAFTVVSCVMFLRAVCTQVTQERSQAMIGDVYIYDCDTLFSHDLIQEIETYPGLTFLIQNMLSYQYRDSHPFYKTVLWQSYIITSPIWKDGLSNRTQVSMCLDTVHPERVLQGLRIHQADGRLTARSREVSKRFDVILFVSL